MSDVKDTARFNARYGEAGFHYGMEPNAFLASQTHRLRAGMTALMPGDGEGRNGVWLAQQGLAVTSFDPASVGVEKSRRLAAERGVTINAVVGDVESFAWPKDTFDVVGLFFLHLPSRIRAAAHRNVLTALKPGGIAILETFTPRQLEMRKRGAVGGPQELDMLFTGELLRADFVGAEFLVLEEGERDFDGISHKGRCAVVDMVAQRKV